MNFHPGILALISNSVLSSLMICYCCLEGIRIIRHWDLQSGSEFQLELERKTYLISTIMTYVMGFQILSLFLFIYTVDSISHLFTGAMCAAGTLNVNSFGYPDLILKLILCIVAGEWLIINYTDNQAHNYPLIRRKYWLLLLIAPLMISETVTQSLYFLKLDPDIITSCCSVIFSQDRDNMISAAITLPLGLSKTIFFLSATVSILLAIFVYIKKRGAILLGVASLIHFPVSILALISFISIYIYELPTHHCPFCILHYEYNFIGYFFYLAALMGVISGIGTGVINPFIRISSLKTVVYRLQKKLALTAMISNLIFLFLSFAVLYLSNLRM